MNTPAPSITASFSSGDRFARLHDLFRALFSKLELSARALLVPMLGIGFFLLLWGLSAPRVETSLGQLPGPFQVWQQALKSTKGATLRSYKGLNHLFVAGEGKSLPTEYGKEGHVAPQVIEDIAAWVKDASAKP